VHHLKHFSNCIDKIVEIIGKWIGIAIIAAIPMVILWLASSLIFSSIQDFVNSFNGRSAPSEAYDRTPPESGPGVEWGRKSRGS
jgi:hypothetical protein